MRMLHLLLCFAAVFLLARVSHAGEPWRVLDFKDAGSTSRCIGKPSTPLCAVETMEACITRAKWGLCERIGYPPKDLVEWEPSDYLRLYYYRYRVVGSGVLGPADVPPGIKARDGTPLRPGDTALLLEWQGCPPIESCVRETQGKSSRAYGEGCRGLDLCSSYPDNKVTYFLRRSAESWRVLGNHYDPVLQGDFWNRK